jgi:glutamate decarboxylase
MSFDLLDRLITDICHTTQDLIDSDGQDLSILNQGKDTSLEKQHSGLGKQHGKGQGKGGNRPMTDGVHRTVC